MDGARRAEIRRWARGLENSETPELRAAARALVMLADENEELERRVARLDRGNGAGPDPPAAVIHTERRPRIRPRQTWRRWRIPWRLAVSTGGLLLVAVVGARLTAAAIRPDLETGGVPQDAVVGAAHSSRLVFWARTDSKTPPEWRLDGRPARAKGTGERYIFRPGRLVDGKHVVELHVAGRWLTSVTRRIAFEIDTRPPTLRLTSPAAATRGDPIRVAGLVQPSTAVTSGKRKIPLDAKGRFELELNEPPPGGAVVLQLADPAGNRSRWRVPVTIVPRRPEHPVRAVHITAYGWATKSLREPVLHLVRTHKINAVELDLKDEGGLVGWDAAVPYGRRIGAVQDIFDMKDAVRLLHRLGARVIGRLVCFRDPVLAKAAWKGGRRNEVVWTPGGGAYADYGGFTNFANPAVRKYNIDIAVAAAKLGVDEILYDYVRRPDGPVSSMHFHGLSGTPEHSITTFLEESRDALASTGALLGASVFGVSATRPKEVAQYIPGIARAVDYISPMLYPSHWARGEYGVSDPNGSPYAIVRRSLADFVRQARGSGARVVPWLQDFSLGRTYGRDEVLAQIRAAHEDGVEEFLLWDAGVVYTASALTPSAVLPNLELTTTAPPRKLPAPLQLAVPVSSKRSSDIGPVSGLPPNELGVVPVVMHHEIRSDRVGDYDQTPKEFRGELEYLWKKGYAPVSAADFLDGRIDLPAGKSPVVLTFDDSTTYQFTLGTDGTPPTDTAIGILLHFARTHPGFPAKAIFYVLRQPFGGTARSPELLSWLVAHGFDLGNHTYDHTPLGTVSAAEAQRELVAGAQVILDALPRYRIRTFALPLGSMPKPARLSVSGRSNGHTYGPYAVFLVGANPAPSPYSREFDPAAIPRIRSSHLPWSKEEDFTFAYWVRAFERDPGQRFVSDGKPGVVTVPAGEKNQVAPRFRVVVRR